MERNKRIRLRDLLYRMAHFFFVCRCISCGEVIAEDEVLCEDCAAEFKAALLSECGHCGRSLCDCLCIDTAFEGSIIHKHIKLYRYQSDDYEAVGNRILYRLKKVDSNTAFRFLGGKLADSVRTLLSTLDGYAVAAIPRSPARVLEFGFDQSERLAKEISVALELPMIKPLTRTRNAKTQKAQGGTGARTKNVEASLRLHKKARDRIAGRRILLVDDIVTSGASMITAARLLREAGAREVIAVSLAVVTRTRNLALEAEENSRLPFYMR